MRTGTCGGDGSIPRRSLGAAWALAMGTAVVASGCGANVRSAARDVPRIATPVVIDESVHSFEDPAVRERVAQIMGSPEMQRVFRDVAAAAVAGGGDELARANIHAQAEALTEAVAKGLVRGASAEIPRALAPAVRQAVVEGLRAPELRAALRDTTGEVVRAALLGTRDVLTEIEEERDRAGPLQKLVNLIRWSWVIAVLFGAAVAVLAVWTTRLSGKAKRLEAERVRLVGLRQNTTP